jgi:hypothetical protein
MQNIALIARFALHFQLIAGSAKSLLRHRNYCMNGSRKFPLAIGKRRLMLLAIFLGAFSSTGIFAQDQAPGPLTPPPEHSVRRVVGVETEAPPSLPPAQIIKAFAQKEDDYLAARPQFAYHKTIRIQEFAPDGSSAGEYTATYEAARTSDGKILEKAIAAPQSTLEYLQLEPEEVQQLLRLPAFPVTTGQLAKYSLQFLGTEKVDEVDCYIFQVNPKTLDRQHPFFDGIVWVDQKYLEVVKTYGKWITDLGEVHPPNLPFSMFETYRENVEGKYWFPNYMRSEGVVKLKNRDIAIRFTAKWSNFKPFGPVAAAPPPTTPAPPTKAPTKP